MELTNNQDKVLRKREELVYLVLRKVFKNFKDLVYSYRQEVPDQYSPDKFFLYKTPYCFVGLEFVPRGSLPDVVDIKAAIQGAALAYANFDSIYYTGSSMVLKYTCRVDNSSLCILFTILKGSGQQAAAVYLEVFMENSEC
jgi:hypothetical protein